MRIAVAADHAGFSLKQELAAWLRSSAYNVTDLGTNSTEPVDYPDCAEASRVRCWTARPNLGRDTGPGFRQLKEILGG